MSQQQIIAKCNEVFALAQKLFGVDLAPLARPQFNLKGRVAGTAGWRRTMGVMSYSLRFNYDMVTRGCEETLRDMVEDTVPHEIAHLVCFMKPELGKDHDYGWQRVCRALGGTGKRTHNSDVVFGRGRTFEYTTDTGKLLRLSEQKHTRVQGGAVLRYRKGYGSINKLSPFTIVGYQGRTLQQPVKPVAVNHPANIEANVRATSLTPVISPVAAPARPSLPTFNSGASKATVAQIIMQAGYRAGKRREEIIAEIMKANGHTKALATSYFKHYSQKVGIPSNYL